MVFPTNPRPTPSFNDLPTTENTENIAPDNKTNVVSGNIFSSVVKQQPSKPIKATKPADYESEEEPLEPAYETSTMVDSLEEFSQLKAETTALVMTFTPDHLEDLKNLKSLSSLSIQTTEPTTLEHLEKISEIKSLKKLSISNIAKTDDEDLELSAEILNLNPLSQLTEIQDIFIMVDIPVEINSYKFIDTLPKLNNLSIYSAESSAKPTSIVYIHTPENGDDSLNPEADVPVLSVTNLDNEELSKLLHTKISSDLKSLVFINQEFDDLAVEDILNIPSVATITLNSSLLTDEQMAVLQRSGKTIVIQTEE